MTLMISKHMNSISVFLAIKTETYLSKILAAAAYVHSMYVLAVVKAYCHFSFLLF